MGQHRTAKMLMLVLCQSVDNWLLSAAVRRLCHNSLQESAVAALKCVVCN